MKFKVFGEGYEKLNSTHPSGISYTLGFCLPIYDVNFDPNNSANGGTWVDVSDADFLSEDGLTNLDWFDQYETVSAGVLTQFGGQDIYLKGSYNTDKKYTRADFYTLDANLLNVTVDSKKNIVDMGISDFWNVYPYRPLDAQSTSGSVSAGSYEATIPGDSGDFTFNKLAIFLKELDVNGVETGVVHFFGMVYSNVKLIKRFNPDPEAYNPAFKIKLNVVVTDLTSSNPYDDYVFINDGYWNLIASDVISTLFHTVTKTGEPDYNSIYRLSAMTHFKRNSDPFGTSQESITEPIVNGKRLVSMSRKPIWYLFTAGQTPIEMESRNFFYKFNIFNPQNPSQPLDEYMASIIYGSETQTIQSDRSFVFETKYDDVAQLPNKIVSRAHFGGTKNGGGNLVFARGIYGNIQHSFIFERGGFGSEYDSKFFADDSRVFGARNKSGYQTGEFTAFFSKYSDIFGEDNTFNGDFGELWGQCNFLQRSYSSTIGNKNEVGLDNGVVVPYVNMKSRGDSFERLEDVGIRIYGESNLFNALASWNSGLDKRLGGGYTSIWGNYAWEAFEKAKMTDVTVFGSFNNLLGTFRNSFFGLSRSWVRGDLDYSETALSRYNNAMTNTAIFGADATIWRSSNSLVNVNEGAYLDAPGTLGIISGDAKIDGFGSTVNARNGVIATAIYSTLNINANYVGGYPSVWKNRQRYTYGNLASPNLENHEWGYKLMNSRLDNDRGTVDYGFYYTDEDSSRLEHYNMRFEWWSVIGDAVLSGTSFNGTYDRDICTIYHLSSSEAWWQPNNDFENINGFSNVIYAQRGGNWTDHLYDNFENGNNWFIYIPIDKQHCFLARIESLEIYAPGGPTSFLKIFYSNPINRSTSRRASDDEIGEGIPHIHYNSAFISGSLLDNLQAYVEVTDENLPTFLASNDADFHTQVKNIPSLTGTNDAYIFHPEYATSYFWNSLAQLGPANSVRHSSTSLMVGQYIKSRGLVEKSSIIGAGNFFANFIGLDANIFGGTHTYDFKLTATDNHAKEYFGYDGSDISSASPFKKYHAFISSDGYDSYGEIMKGRDIHIRHSPSGFGAFNSYIGSEIYVGDDFVNEMVGSTGQMYNFVFGHNIKIHSDSGAYSGDTQATKLGNVNLTAMGINLLVSRSDQFVFGRNNIGDPRNFFEFGFGGEYTDATVHDVKQNGFAFGYIYEAYEQRDHLNNKIDIDLFPAFKIETGYLYLGRENHGIICKEFKASISAPENAIGIGDLIFAVTDSEGIDSIEIHGTHTVPIKLAGADLSKIMVSKYSDTSLDWEMPDGFFMWRFLGVALTQQTIDGGPVLVGMKGGPFPVLRNHSEWPTRLPENMSILSKINDEPYVGAQTFQVYLR